MLSERTRTPQPVTPKKIHSTVSSDEFARIHSNSTIYQIRLNLSFNFVNSTIKEWLLVHYNKYRVFDTYFLSH